MSGFPLMRFAGGLAVAAVVLAGCTVVVDDGPGYHRPPPRPGPSACTFEYAPVCASAHGQRQTFPNACVARSEGFRPVHAGSCRADSRPGPGPERPPRACTREYAPVCAKRGRDVRTFGNACEARAADYRLIGPGRC